MTRSIMRWRSLWIEITLRERERERERERRIERMGEADGSDEIDM